MLYAESAFSNQTKSHSKKKHHPSRHHQMTSVMRGTIRRALTITKRHKYKKRLEAQRHCTVAIVGGNGHVGVKVRGAWLYFTNASADHTYTHYITSHAQKNTETNTHTTCSVMRIDGWLLSAHYAQVSYFSAFSFLFVCFLLC